MRRIQVMMMLRKLQRPIQSQGFRWQIWRDIGLAQQDEDLASCWPSAVQYASIVQSLTSELFWPAVQQANSLAVCVRVFGRFVLRRFTCSKTFLFISMSLLFLAKSLETWQISGCFISNKLHSICGFRRHRWRCHSEEYLCIRIPRYYERCKCKSNTYMMDTCLVWIMFLVGRTSKILVLPCST